MTEKASYSQILKSSAVMGGAASITMILGMVKIKFAAILIGASGIGLLANFIAIQGVVGAITGLGIHSSAVRDVASAVANNDKQTIGQTVLTLRRICWLTGFVGLVTMMLLSTILSQLTFESNEYELDIAALGIIILFTHISAGQMALLQGMRRIDNLARVNIIGATAGTIVTIIFYLWIGLRGIIPALVVASAIQLVISWLFARRESVPVVDMTWLESIRYAGGMVRLGLAFMWSGLLSSVVVYATNTMITQQINLETVGIYTAAFALSGMFVNFVLNAMGADYYPRLAGVSDDMDAMNKLINEQTETGLLLAVPGLIATLCLAPWIIQFFYSSEFLPAVDLLQWFVLGCMGRIVSWPLGYVVLAMGKAKWLIVSEAIVNVIHIMLISIGLNMLGIEGVSVAFFILYLIHILINYGIARHLMGFYWAHTCRRLFLEVISVVIVTFMAVRLLPLWPATLIGLIITIVSLMLCLRGLIKRIGTEHRLAHAALRIPGVRLMCDFPKVAD